MPRSELSRVLRSILPLLALAGLFGGARATETPAADLAGLSLDTLLDMPVTGASRFAQRRSQAASAVTVVTREEIVAFGHRTLGDVLRSVRGVTVSTDRIYDYLGVRGFLAAGDYNTRVLLLVDGNRVNDALYDQAFLGSEFPLDMETVERVEFIPGQGSAIYGANALFGVINVITREAPRRGQAQGALVTGSAGERGAQALLRLPWEDGGVQIEASRQLRRGDDFYDPARVGVDGSDGWSRGNDGLQRSAAALRLDWAGLTASLIHADRQKGTPLTVDLIFGDPRSRYRDTTTLFNLEGSHALGETSHLTARVYGGHYRFLADYAIDYPPPTLNRDVAVASWRGAEARVAFSGWAEHRLVLGTELQDRPLLLQRNVDLEPVPASYLDDRRRSWRAALYGEDQWAFAPGWELHLGLRIDRGRDQAAERSPRMALVWAPAATGSLKLIHGSAFRSPNAYEAFYAIDAPAGYTLNPSLQSERVRGTELVGEWRPQAAWRFTGSVYRTQATRLLLLGYDAAIDRYRVANAGQRTARGGEVEAETAQSGARLRANYSWAQLDSGDGSGNLFPRRMLKGTALLPLQADWTLGLEGDAIGRRGSAPGYGVVHLTLHGRAWDTGPELTLALRNLADRQLFDPGSDAVRQPVVPLPGREVRLELRWALPW